MIRTSSEEENSELDRIVKKIGSIDLNTENFINLKVKQEDIPHNPNVTDIPSTSYNPPRMFDKEPRAYAGLSSKGTIIDKYTPYDKTKGDPINPFGIYLDLDCINNPEEAIDRWETALRIAITINKMDMDTTKHFIERSLLNSVLRYWQNVSNDIVNSVFVEGNIAETVTRVVELIKLEFCGEGNVFKDKQNTQKYTIALLRLQLCDMCEIDKYICVFQDYYYHIYNKVEDMETYLNLFFTKIPDPWGQKLIDTYNPGTLDTLGKRINHVQDKLSEWCGDAILAKLTKGLKKRVNLCCDKTKMPIMIGCDGDYYYKKIKRKFKKRKHFKKRYFKRRKAKYYKTKRYKKPFKPMYKRKKYKECRCYYCKELGHYADKCPKKIDKNKKKFEVDEELLNEMMIQINNFEEVSTDESIFIITDTEYSEESEDGRNS